jgi:hypothetical protein
MSDPALPPPPEPGSASGRTRWLAIGALAVAVIAFVALTVGGIGENLVYYWGPSELQAAGEKAVGATRSTSGRREFLRRCSGRGSVS